MSRMFPLLGSLLGSTPGRRRGGGAQGSFDFTTMSSAQLQEAGWSWTRGNAIWVPDSAGDYAEIASGVLAKSDLGAHCFGGFTNFCRDTMFTEATVGVVGSGGVLPAGWSFPYDEVEIVAIDAVRGLPRIRIRAERTGSTYLFAGCYISSDGGGYGGLPRTIGAIEAWQDSGPTNVRANVNHTDIAVLLPETAGAVTDTGVVTDINRFNYYGPFENSAPREDVFTICAPYYIDLAFTPRVYLATTNASGVTSTAAQIPVLSRVTQGECSFTLPVITSPARKGTDDVIASASLDANNQLLAIHEDADNNIMLRLVTAGSTVGEVDLGIVGNNVYTVISGSASIGRLAGALEGMSEMIEATGSGIIPPPAFMQWTMGNDHSQAAATQFWGSVLGLRIN